MEPEAVNTVKPGIARPSSIPGGSLDADSERRRPKSRKIGKAEARDEPGHARDALPGVPVMSA